MPEQPVIVSDVNETLMDREALRPLGVGPQQDDTGKDLDEIAD